VRGALYTVVVVLSACGDEARVEDTRVEDTRTEDSRTEDSRTEDTSADGTRVDDTSAEDTSAEDSSADDTRVDSSAEDARVDDTSADDTSADDTGGEIVDDPCPVEVGLVAPSATDLEALAPTAAGKVRGVWLAPSDRPFAPGLHARLDAWITLGSDFVADELARWTGSAKTFVPQRGADGLWDVVFMQGQHDAAYYHAHASAPDAPGEALAEIFARLPAAFHRDAIIVYFYDTAIVSGAGLAHTGQGGSAAPWQGDDAGYALIGSHVFGFGFDGVRVDPATQRCAFDDTAPSGLEDWDGEGVWRALDRGEWASTFLGASLHELGHAFGLDHVFDDADDDGVENNLMGNGFRRFGGRFSDRLPQPPTLLGPTSAAALAPHPFLVAAPAR